MSSVPKFKRTQSSFQVFETVKKLRKELTTYVLRDFAINGKLSEMEFYILNDERTEIMHDVRNISSCIEMANSIYVTCQSELDERRKYQDIALGWCNRLKTELNYICDNFSSKVNMKKYGISSKMVDEEIGLIKAWRKSNKKIQEKLDKAVPDDVKSMRTIRKGVEQGNLCIVASASWFANVNNNGNANNNDASNAWNGVRPIPASDNKANAKSIRREGKAVLDE